MTTLYGIPRTLAQATRRVVSGTTGDILWKLFIIVLLGAFALGLIINGGVVAAFIGGTILASLFSDDVRQLVSDIYNRRWAEASLPF